MDNLEKIIEQVLHQSILASTDIPNLDLYIDQIMTLFDVNLQDNKRYVDDKLLTKTMINNYSKAGVIKPVKGKKYNKEQIVGMLLIYYLKNTITIQEIKQILTPIYQNEESLEAIYKQFINIKTNQNEQLNQALTKTINDYNLNLDDPKNQLITILVLSSLASQITKIVEGIIDNYHIQE